MSIKNRVNIQTTIDENLPNNSEGTITPELHREVETDLNDSSYNKITDAGLVGLKIYDPTRNYTSNEATVYNAGAGLQTWLSNKATTGTFIPADWVLTEGAVNEAPIDGNLYSRGNSGWFNVGTAFSSALALKIVRVKADLPAPITGVITLEDSIKYQIDAMIDLGSDKILANTDNTIESSGSSNNGFTGTNATLIEAPAGSNLKVKGISLIGGVGQTSLLSGDAVALIVFQCTFVNSEKAIVINGLDNLFLQDCFFTGNDTCVEVQGTGISYLQLDGNSFNAFVNYGLNLGTSTISSIILHGNLFSGNSGCFDISGLANSGNIAKRARYLTNNFNGLGTALENITSKDLKHEFIYNDGNICNSMDAGGLYTANISTTVTINTIGVFENIAPTYTLDPNSARFSNTTNNQLQCDSEYCNFGEVTFNVTGSKVGGGGTSLYAVGLFENGVLLPSSETFIAINNSIDTPFVGMALVELDKTKYYEARVANIDDTSDFLVTHAQVNAKRLT